MIGTRHLSRGKISRLIFAKRLNYLSVVEVKQLKLLHFSMLYHQINLKYL